MTLTLQDQASNATTGKIVGKWIATVLTHGNGRRTPVFIKASRLIMGSRIYHVQRLRRYTIPGDKYQPDIYTYRLIFFRLDRRGDLVANGCRVLTDEDAAQWIERHKAAMSAEAKLLA